jgi:Uri superfamily endonuclease
VKAATYQIVIRVRETIQITVGKLGVLEFPAGYYVYTGSARKCIQARVRRHVTGGGAKHWHIDYLLGSPQAQVAGVRLFRASECALNRRTRGAVLFPGFGSSDCRSACGSHLKYAGESDGGES